MNNGEINIYDKGTSSGLYMNYNSSEPWYTKTNGLGHFMADLTKHASTLICSTNK